MAPGEIALLIGGLIPFAAFSWGVKGHFRTVGGVPTGMKLISVLSAAAFVWFGWRLVKGPPPGAWATVVALALFMLALGLFAWAVRTTRRTPPTLAFNDDPPILLFHDGPYGYVRHPFYVAYLSFWVGTAVATPGILPWLAPAVMLLVYGDAALWEERKFARSELAAAYAAYRARVGMFLPRPSTLLPE